MIWEVTMDQSATVSALLLGIPAATVGAILILVAARRDEDANGRRTPARYVAIVCFLAVVVVLVAAAFGAYGVFRAIAPGVTSGTGGDVERQQGIAEAISLAFLGAGASCVFLLHWRDREKRPSVDAPAA